MIDISINTIIKMLSNRNTSYKLFLMKYLIENISEKKMEFSFKTLACGMVSEAWKYYEHNYYRYTKNDRIFDLVDYLINENGGVTIYSTKKEVFEFLYNADNKNIIYMLNKLVIMVQYRLLVPFIEPKELIGLSWNEQNKHIKELSQIKNMFYRIGDNKIFVHKDWTRYICINRKTIITMIEGVISDEYGKRKKDNLC